MDVRSKTSSEDADGGDRVWKREKKGMMRRGRKRQQTKDGRAVRGVEAYQ